MTTNQIATRKLFSVLNPGYAQFVLKYLSILSITRSPGTLRVMGWESISWLLRESTISINLALSSGVYSKLSAYLRHLLTRQSVKAIGYTSSEKTAKDKSPFF